jgi:hypothetical protein
MGKVPHFFKRTLNIHGNEISSGNDALAFSGFERAARSVDLGRNTAVLRRIARFCAYGAPVSLFFSRRISWRGQ